MVFGNNEQIALTPLWPNHVSGIRLNDYIAFKEFIFQTKTTSWYLRHNAGIIPLKISR